MPFPTVYRMEEILAAWRSITAPVLWVAAAESDIPRWLDAHPEGRWAATASTASAAPCASADGTLAIEDAGHMVHHDQPDAVARVIEPFLHGAAMGAAALGPSGARRRVREAR